ncbi:TIM barrel protein [Halomonas heilongjiangensis]|uniref:Xylose isomerase n=1 Tax=Halomonas heilongjiangensis TaxID=1387883 RepID=A0A2N7TK92_9GAMM|nr:TIM barrel protein [Halomonas heilongjiangensis]PMR68610.1 xylose isomerase [Halomonas heilongjiangensis]PXX89183.1 xylose isomerase [Halomonas heilongjiangensis]
MAQPTLKFSLNHMVCPRWTPPQLIEVAAVMGVGAVELRNDVGANSILDLDTARAAGQRARELGIEVLSINALYPFNIWSAERAAQAEALAERVAAAGGRGLVLCPLVDANYSASAEEKRAGLEQALLELDAILSRHDLRGFVEPLGFPISSLRTKAEAVAAIEGLGLERRFGLVHDTFHHQGAGETAFFAGQTGLVHISGVEDPAIGFEAMLDPHRLLVGERDRLDNVSQLRRLLADGYDGYVSFEPFAETVHALEDPVAALKQSMAYVRAGLGH